MNLKDVTEDGQQICYAWNNPGEKCWGNCGFAHACRACGKPDHTVAMCPLYKQAKQALAGA